MDTGDRESPSIPRRWAFAFIALVLAVFLNTAT
jgi:hypothetical protein